jgi:hypothetical protein
VGADPDAACREAPEAFSVKPRMLPTISLDLPYCPDMACNSLRINRSGGTIQQGDGSKLQYAKCLDCGKRFRIVWEPPLGGMDIEDSE